MLGVAESVTGVEWERERERGVERSELGLRFLVVDQGLEGLRVEGDDAMCLAERSSYVKKSGGFCYAAAAESGSKQISENESRGQEAKWVVSHFVLASELQIDEISEDVREMSGK